MVGWEGMVDLGGYFCTFLLVKLMGAVLSRYALRSDVKLSVIGQSW